MKIIPRLCTSIDRGNQDRYLYVKRVRIYQKKITSNEETVLVLDRTRNQILLESMILKIVDKFAA